jgi:hypothetical protein
METEKFINFSKRHLVPITEPNDCCICLNPSDRQTKKCSHPICLDCFYKLNENNNGSLKCPVCRDVIVENNEKQQHRLTASYERLERLAVDPNDFLCYRCIKIFCQILELISEGELPPFLATDRLCPVIPQVISPTPRLARYLAT